MAPVGEEPKVPDAHETGREDVAEEAAEELLGLGACRRKKLISTYNRCALQLALAL